MEELFFAFRSFAKQKKAPRRARALFCIRSDIAKKHHGAERVLFCISSLYFIGNAALHAVILLQKKLFFFAKVRTARAQTLVIRISFSF